MLYPWGGVLFCFFGEGEEIIKFADTVLGKFYHETYFKLN